MKYIPLGPDALPVSEIALGCARISTLDILRAENIISAAISEGINFFDHADAYGNGLSEETFSRALKNLGCSRDKIILQSKCTIRDLDLPTQYYDHSKEHIITSVNESLRRLDTDYLDILLLHRPDPLTRPEEVAEAFDILKRSGKVRYFGVSNHNRFQMELLNSCLKQPLAANQMQFNLSHTPLITAGINVNMDTDESVMRDAGTIEYCRLHHISLQAWAPFQFGLLKGNYLGDYEHYPDLNKKLDELSGQYQVPASAVAVAWILRHPAQFQVLVGSMTPSRLKDACRASEIELSRIEWFELYKAAGNPLP
ncbi:aldo/keto reductase [Luxibacter massiliensis]|uniref:aldo/keto reductase n=1 Tax=Luxibacter massiliensis TaxID=2219695 RepID=UPI000F0516D4|nr:aldo/keto reductase [Luxibacter massiliensis]